MTVRGDQRGHQGPPERARRLFRRQQRVGKTRERIPFLPPLPPHLRGPIWGEYKKALDQHKAVQAHLARRGLATVAERALHSIHRWFWRTVAEAVRGVALELFLLFLAALFQIKPTPSTPVDERPLSRAPPGFLSVVFPSAPNAVRGR
ncbi:hypothetical protein DNA98_01345 [Meiothermus sp. Pnk-1]|nr:hypothetical protein DNA98_01345 [Meiothermus sp. Pnk-1]